MIAGVPDVFAQFARIAAGSRTAAGVIAHAAAEAAPEAQRSGLLGVATQLERLSGQALAGIRELDTAAMSGGDEQLARHAFGAAAVARQGVGGLDGVTRLLQDAVGDASTGAVSSAVTDDAMRRLELIGQTFDFVTH